MPPLEPRRWPFTFMRQKLPWEKTGPVALASEHLFTCNVSSRTAIEVAHQQLPSTINFDSVAAEKVIMVFLLPNHNIPGPPPFRYFPPGSINPPKSFFFSLPQLPSLIFITWRGPTTKSRLLKPVSRELKDKGHSHSGVVFCTALEI